MGHPGTFHTACGYFGRKEAEDARKEKAERTVTAALSSWFEQEAKNLFATGAGRTVVVAVGHWDRSQEPSPFVYEPDVVEVFPFISASRDLTFTYERTNSRKRVEHVLLPPPLGVDAAGKYYELGSLGRRAPRNLRKKARYEAQRRSAHAAVIEITGGAMGVRRGERPRSDAEQFAMDHGWRRPASAD